MDYLPCASLRPVRAAGKRAVLVQRAMGHSDLATTMGYAHLLDDDLRALVQDDEDRALKELAVG